MTMMSQSEQQAPTMSGSQEVWEQLMLPLDWPENSSVYKSLNASVFTQREERDQADAD